MNNPCWQMRFVHCLEHVHSMLIAFAVGQYLADTALTLKHRCILLSCIVRCLNSLRSGGFLCSDLAFRTGHTLTYIKNCCSLFAISYSVCEWFLLLPGSWSFIVNSVDNIHGFQLVSYLTSYLKLGREALLTSNWVLSALGRLIDPYERLKLTLSILFITLTPVSTVLRFVVFCGTLRIHLSGILVPLNDSFDSQLFFQSLIHVCACNSSFQLYCSSRSLALRSARIRPFGSFIWYRYVFADVLWMTATSRPRILDERWY